MLVKFSLSRLLGKARRSQGSRKNETPISFSLMMNEVVYLLIKGNTYGFG